MGRSGFNVADGDPFTLSTGAQGPHKRDDLFAALSLLHTSKSLPPLSLRDNLMTIVTGQTHPGERHRKARTREPACTGAGRALDDWHVVEARELNVRHAPGSRGLRGGLH